MFTGQLSAFSMMTYLVFVSLLCVAVSTLSASESSFNGLDINNDGMVSYDEIVTRYIEQVGTGNIYCIIYIYIHTHINIMIIKKQ